MVLISKSVYEDATDAGAKYCTTGSLTERSSFESVETESKYSILGGPSRAAERFLASHGMTEEVYSTATTASLRSRTSLAAAKQEARKSTKGAKETKNPPKKK